MLKTTETSGGAARIALDRQLRQQTAERDVWMRLTSRKVARSVLEKLREGRIRITSGGAAGAFNAVRDQMAILEFAIGPRSECRPRDRPARISGT